MAILERKQMNKLTKKDVLEFLSLTNEIRINGLRHSSKLNDILSCAEYDKLVAMGTKIIPLLLGELVCRQFWWFELIHDIISKDQSFVEYRELRIPDEAKGKLYSLCKNYLSWAEQENIPILIAQKDGITIDFDEYKQRKQEKYKKLINILNDTLDYEYITSFINLYEINQFYEAIGNRQ